MSLQKKIIKGINQRKNIAQRNQRHQYCIVDIVLVCLSPTLKNVYFRSCSNLKTVGVKLE